MPHLKWLARTIATTWTVQSRYPGCIAVQAAFCLCIHPSCMEISWAPPEGAWATRVPDVYLPSAHGPHMHRPKVPVWRQIQARRVISGRYGDAESRSARLLHQDVVQVVPQRIWPEADSEAAGQARAQVTCLLRESWLRDGEVCCGWWKQPA